MTHGTPRPRGDRASCLATLVAISLLLIPGWSGQARGEETPSDFTIAFIGDAGIGSNAKAVLALIRDELADAVIHQGDLDYKDDPAAWEETIDGVLGQDFPYFVSVGNHDEDRWYGAGGYQELLEARNDRLGIPWIGDLGVMSHLSYRGIFIVLTAPDVFGKGDGLHDEYIRDALGSDDSIWRVSSWHKNMSAMQVGGKGDESGWGVYEESRIGGAIIATGHEHSYSRTHLMASLEDQTVASRDEPLVLSADDPATPVDEGRTFAFVSGLGGKSIRDQERDGDWWASVYTSDQDARPGALFGVFNVDGNPRLARFYFKNIDGEIVDEFIVESALGLDAEVPPPDSNSDPPACMDGLDNDGDGEIDFPADLDCESFIDESEDAPVNEDPAPPADPTPPDAEPKPDPELPSQDPEAPGDDEPEVPTAPESGANSGPLGLYPDCIAPAIPLEARSWWWELGEDTPRHLDIGACLPNARDEAGEVLSVAESQPFSVKVRSWNNPGAINWVRWSWKSDVVEKVPMDETCQSEPGAREACDYVIDLTLDPSESKSGGLQELRLSPNIRRNDLGDRQFATLNSQIYLRNGAEEKNYRDRVDPIGRAWYSGHDYSNVRVNYMDFFDGAADLGRSIPLVSGVVPLEIRHRKGAGEVRSMLWLDHDFEEVPEFFEQADVGVPNASGGVLFYDQAGRFDGTYEWDTTNVPDGVHELFFQTTSTTERGMNAGGILLRFEVRNGDTPTEEAPPPQPEAPAPPVDEAPAEDPPVEEVPGEDTPVEEGPVPDAPAPVEEANLAAVLELITQLLRAALAGEITFEEALEQISAALATLTDAGA
jgi:hypothetical protein